MSDRKREPATIDSVAYEDDRFVSVHIMCAAREGGWCQGFGGVGLETEGIRREFMADLCAVFGVADPELLIGKPCFVLRCFGNWGDSIEGLESEETGQRFIFTEWCRERWPEHVKDPLTRRRESLSSDARLGGLRAEDALRDLRTLEADYTEWRSS